MKTDIILAGVGGQGILSIAATIGMAALHNDLYLKQAEVHGMSQRGGAVQSNMRISDKEIASDLIPMGAADIILSVEPMESLRYLPFLKEDGWLVTNTTPFVNIPDYPEADENKLASIEENATEGADWETNITNKPNVLEMLITALDEAEVIGISVNKNGNHLEFQFVEA